MSDILLDLFCAELFRALSALYQLYYENDCYNEKRGYNDIRERGQEPYRKINGSLSDIYERFLQSACYSLAERHVALRHNLAHDLVNVNIHGAVGDEAVVFPEL